MILYFMVLEAEALSEALPSIATGSEGSTKALSEDLPATASDSEGFTTGFSSSSLIFSDKWPNFFAFARCFLNLGRLHPTISSANILCLKFGNVFFVFTTRSYIDKSLKSEPKRD